jgi:hypothetical protein
LLQLIATRAQVFGLVGSVLLVALLAAFELTTGASRIAVAFGRDTAVALDGGWRIHCGQVPHNDYYSPLGALMSYLTALGLYISFGPDALLWANLTVYALAVLTLYWLGRDRLSAFWLTGLALYFGFMLVSLRPLGSESDELSLAMSYNRWGEIFVGLVCLMFLEPFRSRPTWHRLGEWVLVGGLVGLCAFTKVNYFGVAVAAVVLTLFLRRPGREAWGGAIGFGLVVVIFLVILGIRLPRMADDLWVMSQAQDPVGRREEVIVKFFGLVGYEGILPSLLGTTGLLLVVSRMPTSRAAQLEAMLIGGFMLLMGWALYAVNRREQTMNLVLPSLAPIYLLEVCRRSLPAAGDSSAAGRFLLGSAVALVLPLGNLAPDVSAFARGTAWAWSSSKDSAAIERIDAEPLRAWVYPTLPEKPYVQYVNQGLQLLRRHEGFRGKVTALDFANPFSFALQVPPPRGDSLWWHEYRNFSERSHPPPERLFGDVECVLIPKRRYYWNHPTPLLKQVYGPYVAEHFKIKDENEQWTLWVRR